MFTLLHYKGAANVVVVVFVVEFFFSKHAVKIPVIVCGYGAPNNMQEWQIIERLLPPSQSKYSLKFMITINK